jgi:hypothetical protein
MLPIGPNIFMGYSACLVFNIQRAPGSEKIEVSSLAIEYIINTGEISFRSGYRLIDNHRSDPFVQTKLNNFIFGIIAVSSSCSTSFFTNVMGLVICSISKNHHMTLIFVLYMLVSRWWVVELSLKKAFTSCSDWSLHLSFSTE